MFRFCMLHIVWVLMCKIYNQYKMLQNQSFVMYIILIIIKTRQKYSIKSSNPIECIRDIL